MRIDKLLWYLRFARSRTVAQGMAESGHLRVNGRRVERGHFKISMGDVITLPMGQSVVVLELLALPTRRGPAPEASAHYRRLDATAADPIAASPIVSFNKGFPQP